LGLIAGLALGLILLNVAARGISWQQVWFIVSSAHPGWVLLAALTVLLTTTAKTARWHALFGQEQRPACWHLGQALLIGKSLNALLPARMGDVARILAAVRAQQISKAVVLGTLATEKAFDLLFLLLSGGLVLALVPLPSWLNAGLVAGTAGGFLLVVLALAWPRHKILTWVGRWMQGLPAGLDQWTTGVLERMLSGLAALRDPHMAIVAGMWSGIIWALAVGTNYLLFHAFDLDLGLLDAVFLLTVLSAGVTPPTSPGRLGVFHTLTVLSLEILNTDRAVGLAYATVLYAIVYLPEILPGALLLGLRLAANRRKRVAREERLPDHPADGN
jgi:uncharacterized protein (TIRG00374 family)